MNSSGSPLIARMELNLNLIILVAVIVIAAVFLLWFITRNLEIYFNSEKYLEKKKTSPTTVKDLKDVARKASLKKSEFEFLVMMNKTLKIPNIKYILREVNKLEPYLKKQYKILKEEDNEPLKTILFSTRKKLYKAYTNILILKTSRLIPHDTNMVFTPKPGIHYNLDLINSNNDEIYLSVPNSMNEKKEKPAVLSKIKLIFIMNGFPFSLETRVIRYQIGKNNDELLVCSHSNRISALPKRMDERIDLMLMCDFYHAKENPEKKGKFIQSETKHTGLLADISAGGCQIFTNLPIKKDQYIFVEGKLDGENKDKALGTIVRTTKSESGKFHIHIKFIKINEKTRNKIAALAVDYDDLVIERSGISSLTE